ncbi:MAG: hypothetical protein IKL00_10595 [Oscillospiraceae bacterium]|nr:hypothetical protein [Oscillospiraceae bacterium]
MKRKLILLFALAAAAVMLVACGRNRDKNDTSSATEPRTTTTITVTEPDITEEVTTHTDSGFMSDAEDMMSDIIDNGKDMMTNISSDLAGDGNITTTVTETTRLNAANSKSSAFLNRADDFFALIIK